MKRNVSTSFGRQKSTKNQHICLQFHFTYTAREWLIWQMSVHWRMLQVVCELNIIKCLLLWMCVFFCFFILCMPLTPQQWCTWASHLCTIERITTTRAEKKIRRRDIKHDHCLDSRWISHSATISLTFSCDVCSYHTLQMRDMCCIVTTGKCNVLLRC